MDSTVIPPSTKPDDEKILRHIFEHAQGVPQILTATPTTAGGELQPNQIGYFDLAIYWNINGTVYKIPATAV